MHINLISPSNFGPPTSTSNVRLAYDSLPELKLGEKLGTNADQRFMSLGQIPILLYDLQWSPRGPSSIKVLPSYPT